MGAQPHLFGSGWIVTRDGHPTLIALHRRHYSRRPGNRKALAIGPGEKLALVSPCGRAAFAWRLSRFRLDRQAGLECTMFRNEGAGLSSELVRLADGLADETFGPMRHFTFVDPKAVRSTNPGCCFLKAGWRRCGATEAGLIVLERS